MTQAERERRLLLIRADLVDFRNQCVDSLLWRLWIRTSGFKRLDNTINRIDALIRYERLGGKDA